MSNHVLGHIAPKKYQEHALLAKVYYRNYLKFKNVSKKIKDNSPSQF